MDRVLLQLSRSAVHHTTNHAECAVQPHKLLIKTGPITKQQGQVKGHSIACFTGSSSRGYEVGDWTSYHEDELGIRCDGFHPPGSVGETRCDWAGIKAHPLH